MFKKHTYINTCIILYKYKIKYKYDNIYQNKVNLAVLISGKRGIEAETILEITWSLHSNINLIDQDDLKT